MSYVGNRPSIGGNVGDIPPVTIVGPVYNVLLGDMGKLLLADAFGGNILVNLPDITTVNLGDRLHIKKVDSSSNTVTLDGFGVETINGLTTLVIPTQWDGVSIVRENTGWVTSGLSSVGAGFTTSLISDTNPTLSNSLDCNDKDILKAKRPDSVNTNTAITLVLADNGKYLRLTAPSAVTITIPPNSSEPFVIGAEIDFVGYGAGVVTFAAGAGVTIRSSNGNLSIASQYGGATIKKIATDEWILVGALA